MFTLPLFVTILLGVGSILLFICSIRSGLKKHISSLHISYISGTAVFFLSSAVLFLFWKASSDNLILYFIGYSLILFICTFPFIRPFLKDRTTSSLSIIFNLIPYTGVILMLISVIVISFVEPFLTDKTTQYEEKTIPVSELILTKDCDNTTLTYISSVCNTDNSIPIEGTNLYLESIKIKRQNVTFISDSPDQIYIVIKISTTSSINRIMRLYPENNPIIITSKYEVHGPSEFIEKIKY